jgi:hypothetical protein
LSAKLAASDGFASSLYSDGEGSYILGIRGTEVGFSADRIGETLKDVAADFDLETGLHSSQEDDVVGLSRDLVQALGPDAELEFTGQSLGGHLATLAALETHLSATVFNPAGMSQVTLDRYGLNPGDGDVTRIVVDGELASTLQNNSAIDVASAILLTPFVNAARIIEHLDGDDSGPLDLGLTVIPEAIGTEIDLPPPGGVNSMLELHYTESALASLKAWQPH